MLGGESLNLGIPFGARSMGHEQCPDDGRFLREGRRGDEQEEPQGSLRKALHMIASQAFAVDENDYRLVSAIKLAANLEEGYR